MWPFSTWATCNYQWAALDADVKAWQAAGFDDIHMVIRCKHPSFTAKTVPVDAAFSAYGNGASTPPKGGIAGTTTPRCVGQSTAFRRYPGSG